MSPPFPPSYFWLTWYLRIALWTYPFQKSQKRKRSQKRDICKIQPFKDSNEISQIYRTPLAPLWSNANSLSDYLVKLGELCKEWNVEMLLWWVNQRPGNPFEGSGGSMLPPGLNQCGRGSVHYSPEVKHLSTNLLSPFSSIAKMDTTHFLDCRPETACLFRQLSTSSVHTGWLGSACSQGAPPTFWNTARRTPPSWTRLPAVPCRLALNSSGWAKVVCASKSKQKVCRPSGLCGTNTRTVPCRSLCKTCWSLRRSKRWPMGRTWNWEWLLTKIRTGMSVWTSWF